MTKKVPNRRNDYTKLLNEVNQSPVIRQSIIRKIQKDLGGKMVITFFTSFTQQDAMIEDGDAIMLEEVLQNSDTTDGLVLILNSPGGIGLAAERIINVFKSYSDDKFEVIVPNMAKSAATMICLGSNKIHMSKTSELGPIDSQISYKVEGEGGQPKRLSVHSIIDSYDKLFNKAVKTTGRIEPYLLQLNPYDEREIEHLRREKELSESIAVKCLKAGMMKGFSVDQIRTKIRPFLYPKETKSHGRPIFLDQAISCGLSIKEIDKKSELWHNIWELFLRSNYVLRKDYAKLIESAYDYYAA